MCILLLAVYILSQNKKVVALAPASAAAEQTAWDSLRGGEIYWKK